MLKKEAYIRGVFTAAVWNGLSASPSNWFIATVSWQVR